MAPLQYRVLSVTRDRSGSGSRNTDTMFVFVFLDLQTKGQDIESEHCPLKGAICKVSAGFKRYRQKHLTRATASFIAAIATVSLEDGRGSVWTLRDRKLWVSSQAEDIVCRQLSCFFSPHSFSFSFN